MKRIAFDVMGNDNGVRPAIEATIEFLHNNLNYYFILVGDADEINKYVKDNERIKIIDVKETIDQNAKSLSSRHVETSMTTAIKLVRDNEADAVLSAGSSAVYLTQLILILKRLNKIKRPAFMPVFPTTKPGKKFVMLDVGANIITTYEMLVQWALMGSIYAEIVLKINQPKVGILNIGVEDNKGHEYHQLAHEQLKVDQKINYIGFVESRDLLKGNFDVVVSDGYGGNLVLKTMEGTVLSILTLIRDNLNQKLKYKIGALLARGAFSNVKRQFDYRNVGAALVLGVNGLAMKAHGSSNKKAYLGAFSQLSNALDNDFWTKIKDAFT